MPPAIAELHLFSIPLFNLSILNYLTIWLIFVLLFNKSFDYIVLLKYKINLYILAFFIKFNQRIISIILWLIFFWFAAEKNEPLF